MSDDLRQRQQLLKIGTARAGRAPAPLAAPLDGLLPPMDASQAETALWLSLAALDLWERGGFLPPASPAPAVPKVAPPERSRACPAQAESVLAQLLHGLHPAGLQSEWLRLLHRYGSHLPARFLPRLLDMATRQPALRPQLLPVLGERGRWLARVQTEWAWASADADIGADDAAWDTGTLDQRLAALRAWRERDPQGARAALLRLEKPWLGKARIEVSLPSEYHADMRRDGVCISNHPGIGEKAGGWWTCWLRSIHDSGPGSSSARRANA